MYKVVLSYPNLRFYRCAHTSSLILKGPSQLEPYVPISGSLEDRKTFLRMRSPIQKWPLLHPSIVISCRFHWYTMSFTWESSLIFSRISSLYLLNFSFIISLKWIQLDKDNTISIGLIASAPLVIENRVSLVTIQLVVCTSHSFGKACQPLLL